MPAQPFSVHVDPDALAQQDLAAAVSIKPVTGRDTAEKGSAGVTEEHHGARDERLAARQRSERERSGRAAGAVGGRSYAFRRS
jgi:hypothetical protein